MRVLYVVFLGCLVALLWAAWAIARTIRSHDRDRASGSAVFKLADKPAAEDDPDFRR
jgi:hypothetical protein